MTQLDQVDWESSQDAATSASDFVSSVDEDPRSQANNTQANKWANKWANKSTNKPQEKIEYVGAPDAEWPIPIRRFQPQNYRSRTLTSAWKTTVWSVLLCVLIPSAVWFFFRNDTVLSFWIILILLFVFIMYGNWSTAIRDSRKFARARDGFVIAQKDIMDVYREQGLSLLSLMPSRLHCDSGDDSGDWTEEEFPVYALWFYDDGRTHSYVLYWRDFDYEASAREIEAIIKRTQKRDQAPLETGGISGFAKQLAEDLGPSSPPIRESIKALRKSMGKLGRKLDYLPAAQVETMLREFDGTDIRMRPCVLEVQGTKARLRLDKNAPLVAFAETSVDRNIRPGGRFPVRLMDTFNAQEQAEEWNRAHNKRDMPLEQW
ncbi:hypothetical protein [Alloscardovia criceti]|uniref:hypothetical protein n=1 Tax=Alloscardovia criceti TaxID=356828 RepID=UPI0003602647|nr:hypothetical protein [Alloscardovia criceti]